MSDTINIVLDGEPVGWGRPRYSGTTRTFFTPAKTRRYESALRLAAQQAMGERPPFEGPCRVEVTAAFPIPVSWPKWRQEAARSGQEWAIRKPDWENLAKCLDAFNELVWRDDKQVAVGVVCKIYAEKPRLVVVVEPLPVAIRPVAMKVPRVADVARSLFDGAAS